MPAIFVTIFTAIGLGLLTYFIFPAIYDLAKVKFLNFIAEPRPVLNVIKVQKIDFSKNYIGGRNFFYTANGRGRVIHLSPEFNEDLIKENLAGSFFDIPTDRNDYTSYMFHLRNTNKKDIRDINLGFKIRGVIFEPNPRFVIPEKKSIVNYKCENNSCSMAISKLNLLEVLSFGILTANPGNLFEISCEIAGGQCIISHFEIFYADVIQGNKKTFLNYEGKEYPFPEINSSPEKKTFQLINGVWTEYK